MGSIKYIVKIIFMLFFLFFYVATKNVKITFACIISLLDNDELEQQELGSIQLRDLEIQQTLILSYYKFPIILIFVNISSRYISSMFHCLIYGIIIALTHFILHQHTLHTNKNSMDGSYYNNYHMLNQQNIIISF